MPAVDSALGSVTGYFPLEWLVLLLFGSIVAIDALRSGTRRAAVFVLAAPLTAFIYTVLPATAHVGPTVAKLSPTFQAAVFGVVVVVLFVLIYRMVPASFGSGSLPLQALVSGIAAAVILAVVWLQVPALTALWTPPPMLQTIFGDSYRIFWFLAAYGGLALTRR